MSGSDVIGLDDSVRRAVSCALTAADTLFSVDSESDELLADACRASLVNDVLNILVSEVTES